MSKYIPMDIQEEILKRLPVKSLIQFRSVSKPWKVLIDSPDFIVSTYGVHHPQPDRFFLRYKLSSKYNTEVRYLTLVDNDDDDSFVQQDFVPTIPVLVKKFESYSSVVDSSHGLLCLDLGHCFGRLMVYLWNPSIRKSVGIPLPCTYSVDKVIGFGVCPVTFDPAVLYICIDNYRWKIRKMSSISDRWKVQVFTLGTGSWTNLSTNLPRVTVSLRGPQVVIDRFIYWIAIDELDGEDGRSQSHFLIMSFDLIAKEFKEINLTSSLTNRLFCIERLSKLRGSLVVLGYHREFEEDKYTSVCSLWMMMEEEGVSRSFTKLYNINLNDISDVAASINRILGFRKTGEVMMETQQIYKKAKVKIYKPDCKYTVNLGIFGEEYSFFMCPYMETLLLLNESDGYIYDYMRIYLRSR